jgi:hypothetical protein
MRERDEITPEDVLCPSGFRLKTHAPPFVAWHHHPVGFADLKKRLPVEAGTCK